MDDSKVAELESENAALKRRVRKLVKRIQEKRKYERELLINTGATPAYISLIDEKDRKAIES